MSQVSTKAILISYENQPQLEGMLDVEEYDSATRMRNALKSLALFWALALVSVILPIAHFVLVPGFFLAGPFVAYTKYNQQSKVVGGKAQCAACRSPLKIESGTLKMPMTELCDQCWKKNKIELKG